MLKIVQESGEVNTSLDQAQSDQYLLDTATVLSMCAARILCIRITCELHELCWSSKSFEKVLNSVSLPAINKTSIWLLAF